MCRLGTTAFIGASGCGSDGGHNPASNAEANGGSSGTTNTLGGSSSGGSTNSGGQGSSAGAGSYTVPNQDRCSDGAGEVLAVNSWSTQLALTGEYIYLLASTGSSSRVSLELSRVPLAKGPPVRLAAQDLYGFGLGVHEDVIAWVARPEATVLLDEDYVDWNVWTVGGPGQEPSAVIENGVRHISVGTAGIVNSRIEPLAIQLYGEDVLTDLCPATGVQELTSNATVAVWAQYDSLYSCSLQGGGATELASNEEKSPDGVEVDAEYVYWGSELDPGLWRAPLSGGPAELLVPEVMTHILALTATSVYFATNAAPGDIQRVDLASRDVETVVTDQGSITTLTADASHVYWLEYVNQWYCLKRAETP